MKLKHYQSLSHEPAPLVLRNFEEFVNNDESTERIKDDKPGKKGNLKKRKKKIKKYSDLPLKVRKKIIQDMDHSVSSSNYYSKYGNSFNYYT